MQVKEKVVPQLGKLVVSTWGNMVLQVMVYKVLQAHNMGKVVQVLYKVLRQMRTFDLELG